MISERLLSPEEVAQLLQAHDYTEAAETIPGHSCWRAPCGTHMLVPLHGPDRRASLYRLEEQMAMIASGDRSRPN